MSHPVPIPPTVRVVVLDAVGTLIHPDPPALTVYAQVSLRHGGIADQATLAQRFRQAFQTQEEVDRTNGWRTDEQREYRRWQRIVTEVLAEVPESEACFRELWSHFAHPAAWRCAPRSEQTLRALRVAGYQLVLASNFDQRLRTVVAGLPELVHIEQHFISSERGWRKPAPEFFTQVEASLGVAPHEILGVGDDLRNDYEGARNAGWHAMLFDPEGKREEFPGPRLLSLAQLQPN